MHRLLKVTSYRYLYDIIIFITAVSFYTPSLLNGFVGDDYLYFIGNRFISSFDLLTILLHGATGADYCPLRDLSLSFDYLFWGENPFGFHLTNLILFGTTAVLFKHFISNISLLLADGAEERAYNVVPECQAFLAALLFTLHPIQNETVYAVHNRGALLTNLFFILSCLAFINFLRNEHNRTSSYLSAIFFCVLSFMSREYGIILPLVLLLIVAFHAPSRNIKKFLHTIPFFVIAAVFYYIFRQYAIASNYISQQPDSVPLDLLTRTLLAFKIMVYYPLHLFNILIPVNDSLDTSSVKISIIAVISVTATLTVAFFLRHRKPVFLFSLLFYLVCLIPVLNFFKTYPIVSDRYAYLPGIGLFLIVTAVSFQGWKRFVPVLLVVLTSIFALLILPQQKHWQNDEEYWRQQATIYRGSYFYTKLAVALFRSGKQIEAEEALVMARIRSTGANDDLLIADLYFEHGYFENAIQLYNSAINKKKDGHIYPDAGQPGIIRTKIKMDRLYSNLAGSYYKTGDYKSALNCFEQAIKENPRVPELHSNAGALYAMKGDLTAARKSFELAAALDPDYGPAFMNLVKINRDLGDISKVNEYTEVIRNRFPNLLDGLDMD